MYRSHKCGELRIENLHNEVIFTVENGQLVNGYAGPYRDQQLGVVSVLGYVFRCVLYGSRVPSLHSVLLIVIGAGGKGQ